jgi:hypothetical protein
MYIYIYQEVADIKQSVASLRGAGTPNLEALEQLEIKMRQERDGAQQDFVAQVRSLLALLPRTLY